ECLAAVARNLPLDEAVRAGRLPLADVGESTDDGATLRTSNEWCIPACFVHDDSPGGWLFHAPRPYQGGPPPNPLARGRDALYAFRHGDMQRARPALDSCRGLGDWDQAEEIATAAGVAFPADRAFPRLLHEVQLEQKLPAVRAVCAALRGEVPE